MQLRRMKLMSGMQSFSFFMVIVAVLLSAPASFSQSTSTNIQISGNVLQTAVHRLGVNLGDQTYWDSGQMMKNLVFQNPGFEGLKYRSIMKCAIVTANTCTDDNNFSSQPTGFWTGGSFEILSGASTGLTGKVIASTKNPSSCSGCGQIVQFDQATNMASGDYFVVTNYFPGAGDTGWWDNVSGGGTISTETTDLSPNTPGKQALLLSASKAGTSASVAQYFDSFKGLSFIQLNGNFQVSFRAKGVGGSNQLSVSVQRLMGTNAPYLSQTLTLTNAWQDYTLTFSANETGSAVGTVQLVLGAAGSSVELDDVALQQTNSDPTNTTAFRDDVVNTLKQLNPGTIRMMAAGAALGSDIPNQLAPTFGRYREGFNTDATITYNIPYGIHEFMQLCAAVGADPWITIPTATTPQEMTVLMQYLTGNGSDSYSASRIARGQSQPWTSVFNKIHIELGNETWNGVFKGESMAYPGYPQWANLVFGTARQSSGFVASKFDLVLDGWGDVPAYNAQTLSYSTQHDSIDIAPYLLYSANNESQSTMFGALFAEPEMWEMPGGKVNSTVQSAAAAARPANVSVYETNLGTMIGNITQAQLDQLTPSVGAGVATTVHMLEMMRIGVRYQNAFALQQYQYKRGDQSLVRLWGIVIDMGTTNRRRPQFLTQALANTVIGGNMLQTSHSGANPTWNQPLSSDNVQLNGAHYLQSFAFLNGKAASAVLFNLSQTTALPVIFSGENAPTGTVQMTQITSANITDNNETASVVQPKSQTLSGFNSAAGLSLPPFSMTVLTWTSTATQSPVFSVPAGTFSASQTVALSDTTAGATIYYTTDGSTPTTASAIYSSPILVSKTTTLKAIATAPNFTISPVTTALYTIQPVAPTPVLSVPTGTYTSGQAVTITDSLAGMTIYYTLDGSTPTTSSLVYTGPIAVNSNETLTAMAGGPNYTNSGTVSATYTIAPPTTAPVISVPAGVYTVAQITQISDAMPGAVIYYTTNGTTPTTSSTQYNGSVTVSTTSLLQAIAVASGFSSSPVSSALYTISPRAAIPTLSVAGGVYNNTQTVSISDTTPGSIIYYTINGGTPTTSSPVYTGPLTVSSSEYLQANAIAPGLTVSFTATANYALTVGTPTLSVAGGTYGGPQTVVVSGVTQGASYFYTTNGTTPTTGSNPYVGPITVSTSEKLLVMGNKPGYVNSANASASYVIGTAAANPVFSLAAGTYLSAQSVAISDSTTGATIYYTTNGATPTTASSVYSGPITISATETLKAIAIATGFTSSSVTTATYTIASPAATPVLSLAAGSYAGTQTLTISDAVAGATIYYTTNGTVPTTASNVYSGAITVSTSETIEAIAVAPNYTQSLVASAVYTIVPPASAPVFSLAAGGYTGTQTLTISDATAGAIIYYTTNGTVPTTSSTVYAGAISVGSSETVEAIAVAPNYSASSVVSAIYTISQPVNVVSLGNGFGGKPLAMNGSTAVVGTALQLTSGGSGQAGTAWYPNKLSVTSFTTDFDFQLPTSDADGFTFTLQNASKGPYALGGNGGGLGYQFITNSVTVAFNLYQSGVTNAETIGVYTNGVSPSGNAVDISGTGINLHGGNPFHVHMTYSGSTLTVVLTDKLTAATTTQTFTVNIGSAVGGTTAYAGFTGSTGGLVAVQNILGWTYTN